MPRKKSILTFKPTTLGKTKGKMTPDTRKAYDIRNKESKDKSTAGKVSRETDIQTMPKDHETSNKTFENITSSANIPTNIKELLGINLVVDLGIEEQVEETVEINQNSIGEEKHSKMQINNTEKSKESSDRIKAFQQQGVVHSKEDNSTTYLEEKTIRKRGRGTTRKSDRKQKNKNQPSQKRKQKEDNSLICDHD
ncbi:hypothetical protein HAX54_019226 [Datura stramonium]|uniref:Uncharacterized protein n=1 Tax=Datura stramonium TaxID=4076 RepID=A0ABS8UNP9_DATST|nr:hypothetical protein [Datura stramonium]